MGECYNYSWENPTSFIEEGEIIYDAEEILPVNTEEITCDTQSTDTSLKHSESERDLQEEKLYFSSDDIFTKQLPNENEYLVLPMEDQVIEETVIEQWIGDSTQEIVSNELTTVEDNQYQVPLQQDEYITLRPYPCDFCNKRFRSKTNLTNHLSSHQNTHDYYECNECGLGFININELLGHKKIHENESKFSIDNSIQYLACIHCAEGFFSQKELDSHLKLHEAKPPSTCLKCGLDFINSRSLMEHRRRAHGFKDDRQKVRLKQKNKFGTYSCITCGKSFCRQDDLKRHQQNHIDDVVNDPESGFTCRVCCETFAEPLDLLAHAEEHARGFEYSCMVCSENFIDEETCAVHVKEQHPEEEGLHCSKCPRIFYDISRLEKHLLSHKDESSMNNVHDQPTNRYKNIGKLSDQQFSCQECGKRFATRSSQQIHMRIHTGERPYGCSFCHKAFTDGGTLRKHERIHTGEKPYACVICPKAFNQRVVLREHIRSHHSGPDPSCSDSMTPFRCTICSDMFSESQDLIVHVIHHCDINTAMKRKPKAGPRKYVRRSKLKSQKVQEQDEYDFQEENEEDEHRQQSGTMPNYEIDMDVNQTQDMRNTLSEHEYEDMDVDQEMSHSSTPILELPEMENREELRDTSVVTSRAKMIHTEKKPKINPVETRGRKNKKNTVREFLEGVRPRTKNVTYPVQEQSKPSIATFPPRNSRKRRKNPRFQEEFYSDHTESLDDSEEQIEYNVPEKRTRRISLRKSNIGDAEITEKTSKLKEEQSIGEFSFKQEFEQCEQQIVYETPDLYEIPECHSETIVKDEASEYANIISPSKPEDQRDVEVQDYSVQHEIIDPLLELAEISMQHAKSVNKCDMCNSVFLEKSQLISHVRIHI
ncbi:zinc finger and SCAN domain-containing protein 2-like [Harmonia axyridis]|uniref:zinc finger and SCAN domain-containing protein 2-like n=1 Tax=Harmonia axyridis TaxID=115357 RepID=UPI001E275874|nr:zinc finger and SCAN domain-containing protein 2-like [Harmonia axyridis]